MLCNDLRVGGGKKNKVNFERKLVTSFFGKKTKIGRLAMNFDDQVHGDVRINLFVRSFGRKREGKLSSLPNARHAHTCEQDQLITW